MKVILMVVGKTDVDFVLEGLMFYQKRINFYLPMEILEIPAAKQQSSPQIQKEDEAAKLLSRIDATDTVVLLDENGKQYSSRGFAKYIEQQMVQSTRQLIFIVGGAYGSSEKIYKRANFKISLSEMTFPHQLVRLLFLEQLYRAMTIIRNEPYHHD